MLRAHLPNRYVGVAGERAGPIREMVSPSVCFAPARSRARTRLPPSPHLRACASLSRVGRDQSQGVFSPGRCAPCACPQQHARVEKLTPSLPLARPMRRRRIDDVAGALGNGPRP